MNFYVLFTIVLLLTLLLDILYIQIIKTQIVQNLTNVQGSYFYIRVRFSVLAYLSLTLMFFLLSLMFKKTDASILKNVIIGSLTGFSVYSITNFTILTMFYRYSTKMAYIDIIWGTFLFGFNSLIFSYFYKQCEC